MESSLSKEPRRQLVGALDNPRKLHEGPLGMTRPGRPKEQRHFVLYQDQLAYFALCSEAADWGIQAEDSIRMADVEDFEVMDTSFVLHIRGGASITLHQTGTDGLDKWLEAFTSIFADDDTKAALQHPAKARQYTFDESAVRQVYEGQLQHRTGDCWDCRHARLCNASLDIFHTRAEAESGAAPIDSITIDSITEVEVAENGFDLRLVGSDATQGLRAAGPQEFEEWMTAWNQVLGGRLQPKAEGCGWTREEDFLEAATTEDTMGPICEGDVTVVNCKSWSTPRQQYFVVYADRLEHYDDAESAANNLDCQGRILTQDVRSVRVRDDAFHFGLDDHDLVVRVPDSDNMESWITGLQKVLEPQNQGVDSGDSEDKAELEVPPTKPALLSTGEPVMAEGLLGFQHDGRLVRRYCRLYGDRLDCWASTVTYEKRHSPVQRLLLKDVWGIELIGGGFVLNHRGSKMGIHVGAIEDLRAWAAAMLSVLSLSESSAAKLAEHIRTHVNQMPHMPLSLSNSTPSPMTASPGVASNPSSVRPPSPLQTSPGSDPSATASPPRSPPQGKAGPHWVPRVAGLAKSASAPKATTSKLDAAKLHKSASARKPTARGAGTWDSLRMLHRPVSPEHAKREVNEKINAHVPGVQLRRSSNIADKVTGTDRALSPRRVAPWDKIAHAGGLNRERQVVRHRGGGSAELTKVTGKVTEPGRVAFSPRSAGVTEKI